MKKYITKLFQDFEVNEGLFKIKKSPTTQIIIRKGEHRLWFDFQSSEIWLTLSTKFLNHFRFKFPNENIEKEITELSLGSIFDIYNLSKELFRNFKNIDEFVLREKNFTLVSNLNNVYLFDKTPQLWQILPL